MTDDDRETRPSDDWKRLPEPDKPWHEMTPDEKVERLKMVVNRLGGEFDLQVARLHTRVAEIEERLEDR